MAVCDGARRHSQQHDHCRRCCDDGKNVVALTRRRGAAEDGKTVPAGKADEIPPVEGEEEADAAQALRITGERKTEIEDSVILTAFGRRKA